MAKLKKTMIHRVHRSTYIYYYFIFRYSYLFSKYCKQYFSLHCSSLAKLYSQWQVESAYFLSACDFAILSDCCCSVSILSNIITYVGVSWKLSDFSFPCCNTNRPTCIANSVSAFNTLATLTHLLITKLIDLSQHYILNRLNMYCRVIIDC